MTSPPHRSERRHAVEPGEERERRVGSTRGAETVVLICLAVATVLGVAFWVFYVAFPDTQALGLSIGLSLAALALAAVVAAKRIVPHEEAVEEIEDFGSREEEEAVEEMVLEAGEGVSRRKLLLRATGAAGATIGAATLLPIASCGPSVEERIDATPWQRGRRVVDRHGRPIRAEDVEEGMMLTGFPEGAARSELGAAIVLVKVAPEELKLPADRAHVAPEGVIAFSKICPHAGCAVSIYRKPLHEPTAPGPALICPCHYSTFDPRRGGELLFGPAGRDLAQLPLALGAEGELHAEGGYLSKVGPSWSGVRRS